MKYSQANIALIARLISLIGHSHILQISAQQPGIYTPSDDNPTITLKECTLLDGCTSREAKLTLDANWRWIHSTSDATNCYTGNEWNSDLCSDPVQCAQNCVLEGVDQQKYTSTYGIEQVQNGVRLKFKTDHDYGTNVGSRLYVMDEGANEEKYKLFYLKNREFSFDVDVSELECGMNGAMYFCEMDAEGGLGGDNNAGAKFGTGYCDAQCPHDIKFIAGEANVIDWVPNPSDQSGNMGIGKYGSCCAEMDIWEANSMATAYTPHTCGVTGQYRCDGVQCGDNASGERYDGVCDKDGCDINPYRMGNLEFYGRDSQFSVDTTQPMKVVTQFLTSDGTDEGDLVEIRRFYVQNDMIIESPSSTILGPSNSDSITDDFCVAKKNLFGDVNDFQEHGGMTGMGESLDRGQVMIFSLWDDVEANMLWLDSAYPLGEPVDDPGIKRGECPGGESSTPTYLRENFPGASVTFQNAAVGEIGSTYGSITATPITPTTQSPSSAPTEAICNIEDVSDRTIFVPVSHPFTGCLKLEVFLGGVMAVDFTDPNCLNVFYTPTIIGGFQLTNDLTNEVQYSLLNGGVIKVRFKRDPIPQFNGSSAGLEVTIPSCIPSLCSTEDILGRTFQFPAQGFCFQLEVFPDGKFLIDPADPTCSDSVSPVVLSVFSSSYGDTAYYDEGDLGFSGSVQFIESDSVNDPTLKFLSIGGGNFLAELTVPNCVEPSESPSSVPTEEASEPPTSVAAYCCSSNLMNCYDEGNWCNENEANCATCSAYWVLDNFDCEIALWGDCFNNPMGCCPPATCDIGTWSAQCIVP